MNVGGFLEFFPFFIADSWEDSLLSISQEARICRLTAYYGGFWNLMVVGMASLLRVAV